MNNYYDLHSWSKLYREERLTEARVRHLVQRARASSRPPREEGQGAAVSLLGGTRWRCCAQWQSWE